MWWWPTPLSGNKVKLNKLIHGNRDSMVPVAFFIIHMKRFLQLFIALSVGIANQTTDAAPPLEREARAGWIASVDNIDWPSKAGLPVDQQKAELIAMLDRAVQLKLNIIILQ